MINLSSYDNAITFKTAPSGTAGNAITYSERMRIDSSGKVGIGTDSPSALLDIENASGQASLELISSTTNTSTIYMGDTALRHAGFLEYD